MEFRPQTEKGGMESRWWASLLILGAIPLDRAMRLMMGRDDGWRRRRHVGTRFAVALLDARV